MTKHDLRPTDIRISVDNYDDDKRHSEITVSSVRDELQDDRYTERALKAADVHVAGVLGRLALGLTNELRRSQAEHQCWESPHIEYGDTYTYSASCHLNSDLMLDDPPVLWLYVPRPKTKLWIARIQQLLAEIEASNALPTQAEPSADVVPIRSQTPPDWSSGYKGPPENYTESGSYGTAIERVPSW